MEIGKHNFHIGTRTFIVGILNVTPDSFSDGGQHNSVEAAVKRAVEMVGQGADIIEVGGESSRPGHSIISAQEEIDRVLPVVSALASQINVPIAVDTWKAEVAQAVLDAGASMINDIYGFIRDPQLAKICAKHNAVCCLMHNRDNDIYSELIGEIKTDIGRGIEVLRSAGVDQSKIIIDPGIGFAKSAEENVEILRNLNKICDLGFPVMLGTSRKSFIGKTIGLPLEERCEATIATTVLGISSGCDFIRVHDIAENKKAAMMTDYILRRTF